MIDPSTVKDFDQLPSKLQLHLVTGWVLLKIVGTVFSSIRNGGGLRRILFSIWTGENLPQAVAQDYKQELSRPPFPPKDQSTP